MYKRFGFSGIYVFEQFPTDKKAKPTCLEDCILDTRFNFLKSLDEPGLHQTLNALCDGYKKMAQYLDKNELLGVVNELLEQLHHYGEKFGFKDQSEIKKEE